MSNWKVFYRDQLDQERISESLVSKEAALTRAKDLHRRRAALYKIEGPEGKILGNKEIMHWVSENRF